MKQYKINLENNNFNGLYFATFDGIEAGEKFRDIINDGATIRATLTECYIYAVLQGENLLQEYRK